jgi:hypothetical protein
MFQRLSSPRARIVPVPTLLGALFLSASLSLFVFYDPRGGRAGEPVALAAAEVGLGTPR